MLILAPAPSLAQMNTAEIFGLVTDPSGAVVPAARVVATHTATRQRFDAVVNQSGEYLLAQLPVGEYTLAVDAEGFKQAMQDGLVVHLGEKVRQDFTLVVGAHSEVVTVEIAPERLQLESAQINDVIENRQVAALPLKGREFLELSLLGAGVVNPPGGTRGDALQQTGKLINILGQRTGHNLFLVDGVNVTDEYFNNVVLSPSVDDIREFNINKTNYDAEFGGKSGGVINVLTQSGTNAFHGSVYEFVRNNVFDARNFFAPAGQHAPPFRENQFGAALGGPIARDRAYFFVNYDGQRIRDSLAHLFSVPSGAERAGSFGAVAIVNPATGQPFPGNDINVPLDPAAVALLAKLPPPNLPGNTNNLLAVDEQKSDTNQYNARLDDQFTPQDSAFARASVFDANQFDPFGSSVLNEALLPGFGRALRTHSFNLALGETHIFASNVLNEFRFGWLGVSGGQGNPNAGNNFAAQYGLQGTTPNPADFGYPQVSLSNTFSTIGDAAGFTTRVDRNFELYDNVLVYRGKHSIQFGGYFFHLDFNPSFPNGARGIYTYDGSYSGSPLADFLLGDPAQAQVGIGEGAENAHTNWAQFYVQDGWQVTPSLKFDAGLRYEFNQNLVAQPNQTSDINLSAPGGPAFVVAGNPANLPSTASALAALSPIPVVSAASIGWNNSLLTPHDLRFSPRLGLAWKVPGSHDLVVRAGFGVYTNQASYSILQNLAENIPFFLIKNVKNTSAAPAFTTENILTFNPTGAISANSVDHNFRIEYNEVWNLTVERPLTANTLVEAQYVGSRTVHADSSTALNVPRTFGGVRPYPALNAFTTIRWDGWATFNGLTLRVRHHFARGLSFEVTHTWSKSMDDASDAGTTNAEYNLAQNVYDLPLETAVSSFDHRNRFAANLVYDLPFGRGSRGWRHRAVAGWRTSGILIVQSGAPFTVNLSSAAGNDVAHIGLVNGANIERPNLIGDPNSGPQTPAEWFNASAFVLPAQFTFGTAGRNIVVGPGLEDFDLSLQKEGALREGLKLQFRFDAYNCLNHPNFDLPGRIFGAANFGVVSSAEDPREIQFALKLVF
ncbi:MAG TPA: carboxypeptidase regulatory-like domain-containing protein [Terriglobia bacterium]|nr:carboxypeptidase regulatory-like domain-containing protein [Terriglobia bacterium]